MHFIIKSVLALCVLASATAFSEENTMENWNAGSDSNSYSSARTLPKQKYYIGGALGTFVGFGSGHAVQERWAEKGWIFTAGEALAVAGYIAATYILFNEGTEAVKNEDAEGALSAIFKGGAVAIGSGALFAAMRIWQIVDVWMLPSDMKVAEATRFQLSPVYSYNGHDTDYGLSLNFKW